MAARMVAVLGRLASALPVNTLAAALPLNDSGAELHTVAANCGDRSSKPLSDTDSDGAMRNPKVLQGQRLIMNIAVIRAEAMRHRPRGGTSRSVFGRKIMPMPPSCILPDRATTEVCCNMLSIRTHMMTNVLAIAGLWITLTLCLASGAHAETYVNELVNPALPNQAGNAWSGPGTGTDCRNTVVSSNGRFVVFCSLASNLIANLQDTGSGDDLFVQDRQTGQTSLITHVGNALNVASNGGGNPIAISDDGSVVLFESKATNLIDGFLPYGMGFNTYLFNRLTGAITLVNRKGGNALQGTGTAAFQSMSRDGEWVLFLDSADDLIPGVIDTNSWQDVFLFRRSTAETLLISRTFANFAQAGNRGSSTAKMSSDARFIAFSSSATDLIPSMNNANGNSGDVFLFDRQTGLPSLLSYTAGSVVDTANSDTMVASISSDGRWILFNTHASDLIEGGIDNTTTVDLVLHDRLTGARVLVSHRASNPLQTGSVSAEYLSMSDDANWVLFKSYRNDYVAGVIDANSGKDLFLFSRATDSNVLVSHANGNPLRTSNGDTWPVSISGDGSVVIYNTSATDAPSVSVDSNGSSDAMAFYTANQSTRLLSRALNQTQVTADSGSSVEAVSRDGSTFILRSKASNLVTSGQDTNGTLDYYAETRSPPSMSLLTRSQLAGVSTPVNGSSCSDVSDDGRWVLCQTDSSNVISGITAGQYVFLTDRQNGSRILVSRALGNPAVPSNGSSEGVDLSADGRYVLFTSTGNNVLAGLIDQNYSYPDAFVFDRVTGGTVLVSRQWNQPLTTLSGGATPIAISADGSTVLLQSSAVDVIATPQTGGQVYLFDRVGNNMILVSHRAASASEGSNGYSDALGLSDSGQVVLFRSSASNLVAGQVDADPVPDGSVSDLFLYDRTSGFNSLVTRKLAGATTALNSLVSGTLSRNGRFVAYATLATDVLTTVTDANQSSDLYLFDRNSATTTLMSHQANNGNQTANATSTLPYLLLTDSNMAVSDQGDVAFTSQATDLVNGITGISSGFDQIYAYRHASQTVRLVTHAFAQPSSAANQASTVLGISGDGQRVLFQSTATNLLSSPLVGGAGRAWFVYRFATSRTALALNTGTSSSYYYWASPNFDYLLINPLSVHGITSALDPNRVTDSVLGSRHYQVTTAAGTGGSLSPSNPMAVPPGGVVALTVMASTGYTTVAVSGCNGTWSGNSFQTGPIFDDCTVSATFQPNVYAATYTAGAFGSVTGSTTQTIPHGGSGSAVTAVPISGYRFVAWSDGVTSNPRTDTNVTGPITVTAQFANANPSIGSVANRSVLEDSGLLWVTVPVSDLETPSSQLSLSASSSNPDLVSIAAVTNQGIAGERTLSLLPTLNANGGPVVIHLTLEDSGGATSQREFQLTILPVNDAPTATLLGNRVHPGSTGGAFDVPGFASLDTGPANEDNIQTILETLVTIVSDPNNVLAAVPTLSNSGLLSYVLTGNNGYALVSIRVRDNGGTDQGGIDTSTARVFAIQVGPAADLQLALRNGRIQVLAGDPQQYALVIANAGTDAVNAAQLATVLSNTLGNLSWRCEPAWSNASCPLPDNGVGLPNLSVDLGVNQYLRFTIFAAVVGQLGETTQASAQITVPAGYSEIQSGNDQASDLDPIAAPESFSDGFEEAGSGLTVPGAIEALRR